MTTAEAMKLLLEGKKLRHKEWDRDFFIHLVDEKLATKDGSEFSIHNNWDLFDVYEEPKKKVKLYQYLYKYNVSDVCFNNSSEYFPSDVSEEEIRKHLFLTPDSILKRLDHTMIEVEV